MPALFQTVTWNKRKIFVLFKNHFNTNMCERLNEFLTSAPDGSQRSVSRPGRFELSETAPLPTG
jgi:hypothetical protein